MKPRIFSIRKSRIGSENLSSANHEQHHRERRGEREALHPSRLEPSGAPAAAQHDLKESQRQRDKNDPRIIDPAAAALLAKIRRVMHEGLHQQRARDPGRHVDEEIPAPAPIHRDPAAERGTEHRRHHHAHPEGGHRERVLLDRESLEQDRLRERDHRGAGGALNHAEYDDLADPPRQAAQSRGSHERQHRTHQISLAADSRREPAGHRDHHTDRDQIAGDHPTDLIDAHMEGLLHVGQRDIDDRHVQGLQNCADHHGSAGRPLAHGSRIAVGDRVRRWCCGAQWNLSWTLLCARAAAGTTISEGAARTTAAHGRNFASGFAG